MGIPKTIVQQILRKALQRRKLCAWFVPHALTAEQKKQHLNQAYDLTETIKSDLNFLDSMVTRAGVLLMIWKQRTKVPNDAVQTHGPPKNFNFKN